PVRTAWVSETDSQSERLCEAVVVHPEWPADVDDEAVHLVAIDTAVGERALERLGGQAHGRVGRRPREAAGADADDGRAIADGGRHVRRSRSFTFCTLPVAVTGRSARLAQRKKRGSLKPARRPRPKKH